MNVTVNDDNESITLTIETTVGESGLDVSTDGSADVAQPLRLSVCVYRKGDGEGVGTSHKCFALGQTLRSALDEEEPTWLECRGINPCGLAAALTRLFPTWRDGEAEAAVQIKRESRVDGEDAWLGVLAERECEVSWFRLELVAVFGTYGSVHYRERVVTSDDEAVAFFDECRAKGAKYGWGYVSPGSCRVEVRSRAAENE